MDIQVWFGQWTKYGDGEIDPSPDTCNIIFVFGFHCERAADKGS